MLSFVAENGLGWYIQSNSRWKSHSSPGFMENMIVPSLDHSGGSRAHCGRAHRYRACMRIADELPDFRKDEIAAGEVLEIFFPSIAKNDEARRYETETRPYKAPTYAVREQTGREAQGFMNPDPLALRTSAPVRELTYGEYNLGFFFSLVDECLCIRAGGSTERTTMETQARCENYYTGTDVSVSCWSTRLPASRMDRIHISLSRRVGTHPLPFHQLSTVVDLETLSLLSERSTLGYIALSEGRSLYSIQHLARHVKLSGQREQWTGFVRTKTGRFIQLRAATLYLRFSVQ